MLSPGVCGHTIIHSSHHHPVPMRALAIVAAVVSVGRLVRAAPPPTVHRGPSQPGTSTLSVEPTDSPAEAVVSGAVLAAIQVPLATSDSSSAKPSTTSGKDLGSASPAASTDASAVTSAPAVGGGGTTTTTSVVVVTATAIAPEANAPAPGLANGATIYYPTASSFCECSSLLPYPSTATSETGSCWGPLVSCPWQPNISRVFPVAWLHNRPPSGTASAWRQ